MGSLPVCAAPPPQAASLGECKTPGGERGVAQPSQEKQKIAAEQEAARSTAPTAESPLKCQHHDARATTADEVLSFMTVGGQVDILELGGGAAAVAGTFATL